MSGPIRGLHDVEGKLFAVSGRTLYQISNAGVAIPRGTIPGVGRVGMAHNQKSGGNELIVVNGSGGYVWNTATETFTVVTDEGYPGASVVDFVDGYLMQVEPFGRFLFHSDLADALGYNTLDRFEAETAPDRTVGMIVNHQEVWAFGERTIDVFGNTGSAQGTFQNKGVSIARGCAAKWSPAVVDNGTAWLGDDLKVYHATGYGPVRISTRAIEVALGECAKADIRNAFSFVWEDRSHSVYYLTVPNGPTFGFDFSTRLWHRRASWHPERDISGRWRLADLVKSNGEWIGGDYQTGQLFKLDWDYMMEGCDPLVRERVSPVAHNNGSRFTVDEVELFVTTGGKATECAPFPFQPAGPQIEGEAPDGELGTEYGDFSYTITEGSAPITSIGIISGMVPTGLTFNEGEITGTPTAYGIYPFTIRVKDANGLRADHADTIDVPPEDPVACGVDNTYTGGQTFPTTIFVTLGNDPGEVVVDWGFGLPDKVEVWLGGILRFTSGYSGLVNFQSDLNLALDTISVPRETVIAEPPSTGSFYKSSSDAYAEVRVYAPIPETGWQVKINCPDVDAPPTPLTILGACPDPLLGYTTPFSYATHGGTEPYTFRVSTGSLPTGRTIDPTTGIISGEYEATGTFSYTVEVRDAVGAIATVSDSVQVLTSY